MWIVNMNDQAFTDVTLATLDNQHVRAHTIILSFGSTFFKNIFVRNLHQNPLVYLQDITSYNLTCDVMWQIFLSIVPPKL